MKLFALPLIALLLFTGCTTDPTTGKQTFNPAGWIQSPTTQANLAATVQDITPLVADYAADGQINYAQAIPVALNAIAIWAPQAKVQTDALKPQIAKTVSDFTDGSAKTTGQKIAAALTDGLPAVITGAQAVAILSQASVQASNGAQSVAQAPVTSGTSAALDPTNQVRSPFLTSFRRFCSR